MDKKEIDDDTTYADIILTSSTKDGNININVESFAFVAPEDTSTSSDTEAAPGGVEFEGEEIIE